MKYPKPTELDMAGMTGNRAEDYKFNMAVIEESGLEYERRNEGHHVMIYTWAGRFDFWPASAQWTTGVRRNKPYPGRDPHYIRRGVFSLLSTIETEVAKAKEAKNELLQV